jgi:pantoate--beta-alanine ligase
MDAPRGISSGVARTVAELREALAAHRRANSGTGSSIGLVPTMGALHEGHGRLIERAAAENTCVVVSIFVNPTQFNDPKDFERYPRTLDADMAFCEARGAAIVFAPSAAEMYPEPPRTFVEVEGLTGHLCGKFRPGHFRGVATVVLKLFEIVQPDRAYFGEKDAQQLAVIARMVRDLNVPVSVIGVETVREADGLAMSSRNRLLTPAERRIAPLLYQALQLAGRRIEAGARDPAQAREHALALLRRPEIRVEYLEIVDPAALQPVEQIGGPVRVAAAVWLGSTRLIDNLLASPRR